MTTALDPHGVSHFGEEMGPNVRRRRRLPPACPGSVLAVPGRPWRRSQGGAGRSPRSALLAVASLVVLTACTVRGARVSRVGDPPPAQAQAPLGVYYALPRTVIEVQVPVRRTQYTLTPLGEQVARREERLRRKSEEATAGASEAISPPLGVPEFVRAARHLRRAEQALEVALSRSGPVARAEGPNAPPGPVETAPTEVARAQAEVAAAEEERTRTLDGLLRRRLQSEEAYWSFANLGVDLVEILQAQTAGPSYKLLDPKITTRAEADPRQTFYVDLDGSALEERTIKLVMSELGLLTEATTKVLDKGPELAATVIESVAKVAVAGLKADLSPLGLEGLDIDSAERAHLGVDARALQLARELRGLRERRRRFLESHTEQILPETLKAVLAALDREEGLILAQFFAKETTDWTLRAEVTPREGTQAISHPLFAFGGRQGVASDDAVLSAAIPKAFLAVTPRLEEEVVLDVRFLPCPQFASAVAAAAPDLGGGERSLHYRIPGVASARLLRRSAPGAPRAAPAGRREVVLGEQPTTRVLIAQWGVVRALPSTLHGSGFSYDVALFESLGALKKVELQSTAAQGGAVVRAAGAAAKSVLGQVAAGEAARAKAAAGPTELDRLTQQRQVLEELLLIKDLKAKLGIPE